MFWKLEETWNFLTEEWRVVSNAASLWVTNGYHNIITLLFSYLATNNPTVTWNGLQQSNSSSFTLNQDLTYLPCPCVFCAAFKGPSLLIIYPNDSKANSNWLNNLKNKILHSQAVRTVIYSSVHVITETDNSVDERSLAAVTVNDKWK